MTLVLWSFLHTCGAEYVTYSNPKRYHVRQSAGSYNKNITTMTSLELNVSIPENWPGCEVTNIEARGNNPFLLHNTEGPGQIYRTFSQNGLPEKGETVFVGVDYDVVLYQVDTDVEALSKRSFPAYIKDAENKYYTRPYKDLMPDAPEVKPIIDACHRKASGNPVLYAKAVYDWVGQNIEYIPQSKGGMKNWFKERRGDCGSQAAIFVGLCRNGGVPARFIAGSWAGEFNGWHCWAEFYVPEAGWIPIDHSPSGGFGHLVNNHLPLVKANDMKFEVGSNQGGDSVGFVQFGYWFYRFGGGGEGGKIATEFSVESFAYANMPQADNLKGLQNAYREALTCFKKKNYNRSIKICQNLLLSDFIDAEIKNLLHLHLARCYLKKKQLVKSALELLLLMDNGSDKNFSARVQKLLEKVRREEIYVSSLNVERIRQGWGRPGRNKSVEGNPISIAGQIFKKGIGTHSESVCVITTNNAVQEFSAQVGIDDEMGKGRGSVVFLVIGDGKVLWQSSVMKGGDPAQEVNVRVAGVNELVLKVTDGGDGGNCDHADWADAKLVINGTYPAIVRR